MARDTSSLDALIASLDGVVEGALDEAAEAAVHDAAGRTHGQLAASISTSRPAPFTREVRSSKWFAGVVEKGRRGFKAKAPAKTRLVRALLRLGGAPKRGMGKARVKVLRFVVNGQTIFAQKVSAAPPRPFMKPAEQDLRRTAPEIVRRAVGALIGAAR